MARVAHETASRHEQLRSRSSAAISVARNMRARWTVEVPLPHPKTSNRFAANSSSATKGSVEERRSFADVGSLDSIGTDGAAPAHEP